MFGSGASTLVTCETDEASTAVGPSWYLMIVFAVQATSSDVSGLPSDHLPPDSRWYVQVLPSDETSHDLA